MKIKDDISSALIIFPSFLTLVLLQQLTFAAAMNNNSQGYNPPRGEKYRSQIMQTKTAQNSLLSTPNLAKYNRLNHAAKSHVKRSILTQKCFFRWTNSQGLGSPQATGIIGTHCSCVQGKEGPRIDCSGSRISLDSISRALRSGLAIDVGSNVRPTTQRVGLIQQLAIANATAVRIPDGVFSGGLYIQQLDLSGNEISHIGRYAFTGGGVASVLQRLNLARNRLQRLPGDSISGLQSLRRLDLSHNQIGDLTAASDEYLHNLPSLTELNLSGNHICVIHDGALDGIKHGLQVLNLGGNCLATVPASEIRGAPALAALHLHENSIRTLGALEFMNLPALTLLNLSGNQVANIHSQAFVNTPALRFLYLTDNQLDTSVMHDQYFRRFQRLELLDLTGNRLDSVPSGAFSGLPALAQIYLVNNRISEIQPGAFVNSSLVILLLNENELSRLSADILDGLSGLQQLSVKDNSISEIAPKTFDKLTRLLVLDLSNNHLSGLPSSLFGAQVQLYLLDLSSNQLPSVPYNALNRNIVTVVLQENPLVCTERIHVIQHSVGLYVPESADNVCDANAYNRLTNTNINNRSPDLRFNNSSNNNIKSSSSSQYHNSDNAETFNNFVTPQYRSPQGAYSYSAEISAETHRVPSAPATWTTTRFPQVNWLNPHQTQIIDERLGVRENNPTKWFPLDSQFGRPTNGHHQISGNVNLPAAPVIPSQYNTGWSYLTPAPHPIGPSRSQYFPKSPEPIDRTQLPPFDLHTTPPSRRSEEFIPYNHLATVIREPHTVPPLPNVEPNTNFIPYHPETIQGVGEPRQVGFPIYQPGSTGANVIQVDVTPSWTTPRTINTRQEYPNIIQIPFPTIAPELYPHEIGSNSVPGSVEIIRPPFTAAPPETNKIHGYYDGVGKTNYDRYNSNKVSDRISGHRHPNPEFKFPEASNVHKSTVNYTATNETFYLKPLTPKQVNIPTENQNSPNSTDFVGSSGHNLGASAKEPYNLNHSHLTTLTPASVDQLGIGFVPTRDETKEVSSNFHENFLRQLLAKNQTLFDLLSSTNSLERIPKGFFEPPAKPKITGEGTASETDLPWNVGHRLPVGPRLKGKADNKFTSYVIGSNGLFNKNDTLGDNPDFLQPETNSILENAFPGRNNPTARGYQPHQSKLSSTTILSVVLTVVSVVFLVVFITLCIVKRRNSQLKRHTRTRASIRQQHQQHLQNSLQRTTNSGASTASATTMSAYVAAQATKMRYDTSPPVLRASTRRDGHIFTRGPEHLEVVEEREESELAMEAQQNGQMDQEELMNRLTTLLHSRASTRSALQHQQQRSLALQREIERSASANQPQNVYANQYQQPRKYNNQLDNIAHTSATQRAGDSNVKPSDIRPFLHAYMTGNGQQSVASNNHDISTNLHTHSQYDAQQNIPRNQNYHQTDAKQRLQETTNPPSLYTDRQHPINQSQRRANNS